MELPLVTESPESFTIQAGASRLTFVLSAQPLPAGYHFAFNIPENQLAVAKRWLSARVELRQNGASDEWFFPDWNAHAVYFGDPAGNALEFIARHNLPNANHGTFDRRSLLSISEIGLVTPEVRETCRHLSTQLGFTRWRGNDTDFAAVGAEDGLFIVVATGRRGLAFGEPAQPLPTSVVVRGANNARLMLDDLSYQIDVQAHKAIAEK
jgi:catechol-2,3-dioxygenase